jgi:hypothetical protein
LVWAWDTQNKVVQWKMHNHFSSWIEHHARLWKFFYWMRYMDAHNEKNLQ